MRARHVAIGPKLSQDMLSLLRCKAPSRYDVQSGGIHEYVVSSLKHTSGMASECGLPPLFPLLERCMPVLGVPRFLVGEFPGVVCDTSGQGCASFGTGKFSDRPLGFTCDTCMT